MRYRILQVTDTLQPGGAERVAVDLANQLVRSDCQVFYCATRKSGTLRNELSGDIVFFCLNRKHTFQSLLLFRRKVIENKIEIVHAHGNSTAQFCILSLFGLPVKIVHHDHNPLLEERNLFIEKLLLNRCDSWVAVSTQIMNWAKVRVKSNRVTLLANPVNVFRFSSSEKNRGAGEAIAVMLANYRPQKDYGNLCRALQEIRNSEKSLKMFCYGSYLTSDYGRIIENLVREMGIGHLIELNESLEDVTAVLSQASFGLLSSEQEGLPISLLEYMAAGIPVIVTDVGECGRLVRESGCGIVVPPKNPFMLSKAINNMLESRKEWNDWGNRGRAFVNAHHSLEAFTQSVMKIYSNLLESGK